MTPIPHRREFTVPQCAIHPRGQAFTHVYDPARREDFKEYGLHLCEGGEIINGEAYPYTQLIYVCGCTVDISPQLYGTPT